MGIKRTKRILIILLVFTLTSFFVFYLSNLILDLNTDNIKQPHLNTQALTGNGTEASPFEIASELNFYDFIINVNEKKSYTVATNDKIQYYYNAHFKLTTDLDFIGYDDYLHPVGGSNGFYGVFDGGGHVIKNAIVKFAEKDEIYHRSSALGLFSHIDGTEDDYTVIKNLKVQDLTFVFPNNLDYMAGAGAYYVGGIVGAAEDYCKISNCEVDWLNISFDESHNCESSEGFNVGGIIGYCETGPNTIQNCKAELGIIDLSGITGKVVVSGISNADTVYQEKNKNIIEDCVASVGSVTFHADAKWSKYNINNLAGKEKDIGITDCYYVSNGEEYSGLDMDSIRGSSGKVWYRDTNYSNVHYLRMFIDWLPYYFKVDYKNNEEYTETSNPNGPKITAPESGSFSDMIKGVKLASESKTETTLMGLDVKVSKVEGYNFTGWEYQAFPDKAIYHAQHSLTTYNIDYALNNGTDNGNPTTYTIETNDITLKAPSRTGYKFIGWTGSNGEIKQTSVTIPKYSIGNKFYTAHWELIKYKITYDLDRGSLPSGKTNLSEYTIETDTFTLNNPTKNGYDFDGWTGTGLSYTTETVKISKGSTGDREYTAKWSLKTYTINYNMNGGIKETTYKESYIITDTAFTLSYSPTKTGCDFIGWIGSNGSTPQTTITVAKETTGNLIYTAQWETIIINITFKKLGNAILKIGNNQQNSDYTMSIEYGTNITTSSNKVNNEYTYIINGNKITYKISDLKYYLSDYKFPSDVKKLSWKVDDSFGRSITINPTISLKEYGITLK